MNFEEALQDKTSGPRPLTIEEYRRRQAARQGTPQGGAIAEGVPDSTAVPTTRENQVSKRRGGVEIETRKSLAEYYRLLPISDGPQREKFVKEIARLRKERKARQKAKKMAKKEQQATTRQN